MAKKKVSKKAPITLDNLMGFIRKGARAPTDVDKIPTGYFELDFAINFGILPGNREELGLSHKVYDPTKPLGIPCGRLVEIFGKEAGGKSYLCYRLVGSAQKMGFKTGWIDTEQSFSEDLAIINGVDLDQVYLSDLRNLENPDKVYCAEDIMDNIVNMMKAGIRLIILDSTANLVPREVMNSPADKQNIARLARLLSQNLGKITQWAGNTESLVVFVNQIREKVGVMFGCFHYTSRVLLADGTTKKIGTIVNNKMDVDVMSYNVKTGKIEPKKIIAWHNNGSLSDNEKFLQFTVQKYGGNGVTQFACTKNHLIFVPEGYFVPNDYNIPNRYKEVKAGSLQPGDKILISQPHYLSDIQKQMVYGSILGDGSIRNGQYPYSCSYLRIAHGYKQREYCQWKQEIMQPYVSYVKDKPHRYGFSCMPMYELNSLRYKNKYKDTVNNIIPREISEKIDALGLAIWYLDDGTFSGNYKEWGNGKCIIYSTKFDNLDIMLSAFNRFDIFPKIVNKGIAFDSANTKKFHSLICKFVPPCMDYKIHTNFRGKYSFEVDDLCDQKCYKAVPAEIIDIYEKPPTRTKKKFDLTIEDNGTYIVDRAIVHNSPETTPGGRALKHLSSLRIRITPRTGADDCIFIEDDLVGKKLIGRNSVVKLVKNRFARPLLDGDGKAIDIHVPIYYEPYFPDIEETIFHTCRQHKLISVYKGEFKWIDAKGKKHVGDGKNGFVQMVKDESLTIPLIEVLIEKSNDTGIPLPPEITRYYSDNAEKEHDKKDIPEKRKKRRGRPPKKKNLGDDTAIQDEAVDVDDVELVLEVDDEEKKT